METIIQAQGISGYADADETVYLLAMKASNDTAKLFQRKLVFDIIPTIHRCGFYGNISIEKLKELFTEKEK